MAEVYVGRFVFFHVMDEKDINENGWLCLGQGNNEKTITLWHQHSEFLLPSKRWRVLGVTVSVECK
jgi:hypothetical protein